MIERCLIYIIRNKVDSRIYIGQTWTTIKRRWKNGTGYKNNLKFNTFINEIGKDQFYHEELCNALTQSNVDFLENYFIEKYDSTNPEKGFNIQKGGSNGRCASSTKQKLSEINKGKVLSENHKQKISIAHKGKKLSEEHVMNMSIAQKNSGRKPPTFDGPHTEYTRKQISEKLKGRPTSDETRAKLVIANSGENNPQYGKYKDIFPLKIMTEIQNSNLSERKLAKNFETIRSVIRSIKKRKLK